MSRARARDRGPATGDLALEDAAAWLGDGGLLAYPTETVWGLAVASRDAGAVERLRAFKGRAQDAPLSILVSGLPALAPLGFRLGATARRLAGDFWPGPLTLVIACDGRFAPGVARDDGAVGARCSPHPSAGELAARCERAGTGPPTATSCNRSGEPAARTRTEARRVCEGDARVRLLAGGPDAAGGAGSTVVDVTGTEPRVLRWGALAERDLGPVLEELAA